jgi:AraC-like DNA-binding protein
MSIETQTKAIAERWLRSSLPLTAVRRKVFSLGPASQDEIITTNRFILILRGKLDYTVEGKTVRMSAGTQFLVPAWIRRVWSVPRGGPCEIIWCEFDDAGRESGWTACRRRKLVAAEFALERKEFRDLLKLHHQSDPADASWSALLLEAELKTMLLRFLEKSESTAEEPRDSQRRPKEADPFHPRVKVALKWLNGHFLESDALDGLYRESGMTPNYFRRLFVRAMQCPPQVYIERLRLRHGRYLLHEKDWPIKQIAAACGYQDALYFSRIYHRFWGHPPARERAKV